MKIIDLLNKIANGEEVPNFKYKEYNFSIFNSSIHNDTNGKWLEMKISNDEWEKICWSFLNDEVKILDIEYLNNDLGKKLLEPFYKIEKLNKNRYIDTDISIIDDMFDKINEIIDRLNNE